MRMIRHHAGPYQAQGKAFLLGETGDPKTFSKLVFLGVI